MLSEEYNNLVLHRDDRQTSMHVRTFVHYQKIQIHG